MISHAGELDRRIVVQSQTTTANDFGEYTGTWGTKFTCWSKVVEKSGKEGETGSQIMATKRVEFYIRHVSNITAQDRISYDGDIYTIESVTNADQRKSFMKIVTRWED